MKPKRDNKRERSLKAVVPSDKLDKWIDAFLAILPAIGAAKGEFLNISGNDKSTVKVVSSALLELTLSNTVIKQDAIDKVVAELEVRLLCEQQIVPVEIANIVADIGIMERKRNDERPKDYVKGHLAKMSCLVGWCTCPSHYQPD